MVPHRVPRQEWWYGNSQVTRNGAQRLARRRYAMGGQTLNLACMQCPCGIPGMHVLVPAAPAICDGCSAMEESVEDERHDSERHQAACLSRASARGSAGPALPDTECRMSACPAGPAGDAAGSGEGLPAGGGHELEQKSLSIQ